MSVTKEQILKMIQEEVDEEIREGFFSRLFGGGDDEEEKSAEEAPAEEEPQEPEEPDDGCDGRGQDIYTIASKIFKNKSPKDLDVFEQFGVGPMRLLRDIARIIKDDPSLVAKRELSPFVEAGSRYTKHGKELSFRYLGNALSNALKSGEKWQFGGGPCVDGGELSTGISFAFGEAEELEKTFAGNKPELDVDHLLSRHESIDRTSRLEEVIREEISKVIDDLSKEDK